MTTLIGASNLRTRYLDELKTEYQHGRLVLFTGAGVSAPYGIPHWNDLVIDILINQTNNRYDDFLPHYRSTLASWLADELGFSPILLARLIRYRNKFHAEAEVGEPEQLFRSQVREALYRSCPAPDQLPYETTLSAIAKILKKNQKVGKAIPAVLTLNFDCLLEELLTLEDVRYEPVYSAHKPKPDALPILHLHGYIPREADAPTSKLVFTEDDYNRLTFDPFHWATSEISYYLKHYTVLFIGLSMSDPNLRRLLDATYNGGEERPHYLLRRDYGYMLAEDKIHEAIIEIEKRLEQHRRRTGAGEIKAHADLKDAVGEMLEMAHRYDRELFKDLGINTLWLDNYGDIPAVLNWITGD